MSDGTRGGTTSRPARIPRRDLHCLPGPTTSASSRTISTGRCVIGGTGIALAHGASSPTATQIWKPQSTARHWNSGCAPPSPSSVRASVSIIQPMDERGPYADSLRRNGDADSLHHVRLDVPEFARTKDELAALDLPVRLDATFRDASGNGDPVGDVLRHYGRAGVPLEIGDAPPGFSVPHPDYVYPPAD